MAIKVVFLDGIKNIKQNKDEEVFPFEGILEDVSEEIKEYDSLESTLSEISNIYDYGGFEVLVGMDFLDIDYSLAQETYSRMFCDEDVFEEFPFDMRKSVLVINHENTVHDLEDMIPP